MIIAIASQKGGVGKTTTSISLAAGIARRGKRTLLIDIDSQANSSKVLVPEYQSLKSEHTLYRTIIDRQPLAVHPSNVPNLDVVPAHILLSDTDIQLTLAKDHREARLKNQLDQIRDQYDHVVIDCPPALSWLTINALTAADAVIVVVSPGYFELDSIVQIGKTLEEVSDNYNPKLRLLGLLFTMSDPTNNSQISHKTLKMAYGEHLLRTVIPKNTDIRDAHLNQKDIFAYSPSSRSAEEYNHLIDELRL